MVVELKLSRFQKLSKAVANRDLTHDSYVAFLRLQKGLASKEKGDFPVPWHWSGW